MLDVFVVDQEQSQEKFSEKDLSQSEGTVYKSFKKNLLPLRVSGTLKPVEYAGKARFSQYCRFHGLNRP